MAIDPEQIRKRLIAAVGDSSQADLARRTNTNRLSVRRILQGARIPVEFVAAVADAYGVSIEWLITGKGAAEALGGGVEESRSLTETVLKANEASRQSIVRVLNRKGGRDYLDLADSLSRLEQTQSELTERCIAELQIGIENGKTHLSSGNLALAKASCSAIDTLLLFARNDDIYIEALEFKALVGVETRDYGRALQESGQALGLRLATSPALESELVDALFQHARILGTNSRNLEATGILEGVISYSETVGRWNAELSTAHRKALSPLYALSGRMLLESGLLRRGLSRLTECVGELVPDKRAQFQGEILFALVLGDALSFEAAIAEGTLTTRKLLLFGRLALATESMSQMDCWLKHARSVSGALSHELVPICIGRIQTLRRALKGKGTDYSRWLIDTKGDPDSTEFIDWVHAAQHQQVSENIAEAVRQSERAEKLRRYTHRTVVELATHFRTRLRLPLTKAKLKHAGNNARSLLSEAREEGNFVVVRMLAEGLVQPA